MSYSSKLYANVQQIQKIINYSENTKEEKIALQEDKKQKFEIIQKALEEYNKAMELYKSIEDEDVVPILISGGTNSFSKELANKTNVRINGVSIGTYARDLIEEHISKNNFYENHDEIMEAFKKAKQLVEVSTEKFIS